MGDAGDCGDVEEDKVRYGGVWVRRRVGAVACGCGDVWVRRVGEVTCGRGGVMDKMHAGAGAAKGTARTAGGGCCRGVILGGR